MSVIKSVNDGSVTVATLQLLKQYSERYFKLGYIHQKNENSARDVKDDLLQRAAELDAFFELRNQLECFIELSDLLPSGKSDILNSNNDNKKKSNNRLTKRDIQVV